jgi:CRP-like cAMP-binding protein
MMPQKFAPGEKIIKYGDEGSTYYILSKGTVKVILYQEDAKATDPDLDDKVKLTKTMQKGAGFGELALLYNDKRSATIEAVSDCETYTL